MRLALLAAASLALCGAADDPYAKLARLTVDQFASKMDKRDDDLTTGVALSTRAGYKKRQSSGGWLTGIESDVWLASSVDKRTGAVVYQVVAQASWVGSYAIWRTVTFTTPSGPQEAPVIDGSSARIGSCVSLGCSYDATIAFTVDRDTLERVSIENKPWRFRFRSLTGNEFENAISSVEARAMLDAVQQVK